MRDNYIPSVCHSFPLISLCQLVAEIMHVGVIFCIFNSELLQIMLQFNLQPGMFSGLAYPTIAIYLSCCLLDRLYSLERRDMAANKA